MATNDHHYYLQQMGIEVWQEKPLLTTEEKLQSLATEVAACTKCPLYESRSHTVFSRGNSQAKLMIIGEAPGFYEDKQGLPFVGKAGALLQEMLKSIQLTDQDVYIANVLKCRPPDNRDPKPAEIAHCSGYLSRQIALVSPKLLVALGRFAGQFLINQPLPLHRLRSQINYYNSIPFMVTYHPAYLLRQPADKTKAYRDLLQIKQFLMNG